MASRAARPAALRISDSGSLRSVLSPVRQSPLASPGPSPSLPGASSASAARGGAGGVGRPSPLAAASPTAARRSGSRRLNGGGDGGVVVVDTSARNRYGPEVLEGMPNIIEHNATGTRVMTGQAKRRRAGAADIPAEFLCPITKQVMADPVMTADGTVFERVAIETWMASHVQNPLTGCPVGSKVVVAQSQLQRDIQRWIAADPGRPALLRRRAKEQYLEFAIQLRENQVCDFGDEKLKAEAPRVLGVQEDVWMLLRKLGLTRYFGKMRDWGFDSMTFLIHATDEHLKELGMLPGHRLAVLAAARDIRAMVVARDIERDAAAEEALRRKELRAAQGMRAREAARLAAVRKERQDGMMQRHPTPKQKSHLHGDHRLVSAALHPQCSCAGA